jgi:hypothetical protein
MTTPGRLRTAALPRPDRSALHTLISAAVSATPTPRLAANGFSMATRAGTN